MARPRSVTVTPQTQMNFSKLSLLLVLCAVPAHADVVDTYVQAEMTKRHIPGLSFVLVKHKQIVRASNYGLANVELNVPVNEHTSFEIASMTKQFTHAAILLLAEEGRLSPKHVETSASARPRLIWQSGTRRFTTASC